MGYKFGILLALFAGGLVTVAKPQQQANYELAEKFNAFDLGGKLSRNSLAIYPHEINGTDNFWFDFQTTDGKFYYYTTVQAGAPYNSKVVGVAVSDSPTGPFIDARGTPLITDDMTPNGPRGWWNDIDPTVFVDDDGTPCLLYTSPSPRD